MAVKVIEMLIPKSNTYTRPGRKRKPKSITIHETDNENVRANALAHAKLQVNGNRRQASWNLSVDDEPEVYLSIPLDEVTFHAGDSTGNEESISIEMCVNKDGDYLKTVSNTIKLVKWLIEQYPSITHVNVVQHYDWSKKNCPRYLRAGTKGINWSKFIDGVKSGKSDVTKPSEPPKYEQTVGGFKVGQKVTLKSSATKYATGETIPKKYRGKSFTVQQRGSNRILLKELYSWVHTKDLEGGKTSSKPKPKPSPSKDFKVGQKVIINSNATKYATGETIPKKYRGKSFTIQQVKSDRILIKELYSWILKSNVSGNTQSQSNNKKPSFKVGGKVKIKNSAKKYTTGENIPNKYKGKSFTIQQVKSDRVLLKELFSWVYKKDLQ